MAESSKLAWPSAPTQSSIRFHFSKLKASLAGWRHYSDKTAPVSREGVDIVALLGTSIRLLLVFGT